MSQARQPSIFSQATFLARKYSLVISASIVCLLLFVTYRTFSYSGTARAAPHFPQVGSNAAASTCPPTGASNRLNSFGGFDGTWNSQRDSQNLLLSSDQCDAAFPGLYDEIDRMVASRREKKITLKELDDLDPEICDQVGGHVKGYIYDHNVRLGSYCNFGSFTFAPGSGSMFIFTLFVQLRCRRLTTCTNTDIRDQFQERLF